jgi:polysaccharide biosynthesis transport protein
VKQIRDVRDNPTRAARLIARQWPLLLACAVIAGAAAYWVSHRQAKKYTASALIAVASPNTLAQLNGEQVLDVPADTEARDASTVAALITQPTVLEQTASSLGHRLTPSQLLAALNVVVNENANLISVSATTGSAPFSADVANATVRKFIGLRQESEIQSDLSAQKQIRQQLAALGSGKQHTALAQLLGQRLRAVQALAAAGSDVSIAQTAQPPLAPSSPRPKRLALVGVIAGLLIGLLLAFLRSRADDRVLDSSELQELWPLPVVGVIPNHRQLSRQPRRVPAAAVGDVFAVARARIALLLNQTPGAARAVAVCSASEGEGKTTCAWQLAQAAAAASTRVLLIEGDLRKPDLAQRLSLPSGIGLADYLAGASFDDVVTAVPTESRPADGPGLVVDVVFAGKVGVSASGLLAQGGLRELLKIADSRYELILIDAPPRFVSDAVVLVTEADAVLVVARVGVVTRARFAALRAQLNESSTPVIGMIVNGATGEAAYGYEPAVTSAQRVIPQHDHSAETPTRSGPSRGPVDPAQPV